MSSLEERARDWLARDPDPRTRAELTGLLTAGETAALADRFTAPLRFGTAGLRGEMGAGPNRMNRVTVMRASAGLAARLKEVSATAASAVVGYDARHNSAVFARDTAAVLTGAGVRVSMLPGPLPTPVLAFAVRHLGTLAGVMVTASHNPAKDNGYKVYWSDGAQILPPLDAEIATAIEAADPVDELPLGTGWQVLDESVVEAYLRALDTLLNTGPVWRSRTSSPARGVSVACTPMHGVGGELLMRAFARAGFPEPATVADQFAPDPDFPTVPFPNPEEPGAMDRVMALAREVSADLAIATDPDADRCAIAVGDRVLTGDEVGGLLAEHVLRHTTGDDRLVVTSIVSSSLLESIARAHGVRFAPSLTGFKWITHAGSGRLVYGYEEALGYCVGSDDGVPVRDKDGIGAALIVAAIAAEARLAGRTLLDVLDDQARRYGLHATAPLTIRVADKSIIDTAVRGLCSDPPAALAGHEVTSVEDLSAGVDGLPPTEGVRLRLGDAIRIVARPSGTEPKLKCYLEVVEPVTGPVEAARRRATALIEALRTDLAAILPTR